MAIFHELVSFSEELSSQLLPRILNTDLQWSFIYHAFQLYANVAAAVKFMLFQLGKV